MHINQSINQSIPTDVYQSFVFHISTS